MAANKLAPPPPPGFELDAPSTGGSSAPPPPPGFQLDKSALEDKPQSGPVQAAGNFIGGLWKNINPVAAIGQLIPSRQEIGKGVNDAADAYHKGDYLGAATDLVTGAVKSTAPYRLAHGVVSGAVDQGQKAVEAFRQGRYSEAAGHGVAAAIPVLGPTAASAAERLGGNVPMPPGQGTQLEGDYKSPDPAGAAGEIAGMVAPKFLGKLKLGPKASTLQEVAERHYQGALKPVPSTPAGEVTAMVRKGLDEGIPVSKKGLEQTRGKIDAINDTVDSAVQKAAAAGKTVDPVKVASETDRSMKTFETGDPLDQAPIEGMRGRFLKENSRPSKFTKIRALDPEEGGGFTPVGEGETRIPTPIPIDKAQSMKRANYRINRDSAYGEQVGAVREGRKDLARGLKDGVYEQLPPEISLLGPHEKVLIDLEGALERYANRHGNRDAMGIGSTIATGAAHAVTGSAPVAAGAGFVKAAMDYPPIKSRIAIALSKAAKRKASGVSTPIAAPLAVGSQIAAEQSPQQ